jgi:hypothetical protein
MIWMLAPHVPWSLLQLLTVMMMRRLPRRNASGDFVLVGTLASLFAPFWCLDAKGGEEVY